MLEPVCSCAEGENLGLSAVIGPAVIRILRSQRGCRPEQQSVVVETGAPAGAMPANAPALPGLTIGLTPQPLKLAVSDMFIAASNHRNLIAVPPGGNSLTCEPEN